MRKYNVPFMIYLSSDQREFLSEKSEEAGITSSQYVRMLIQSQMKAVGKKSDLMEQIVKGE